MSTRLRENKAKIVNLWAQRVRVELPAARQQESYVLEDRIPEFIGQLADALSSTERQKYRFCQLAKEHGKSRAEQPSYSLYQVVVEYHVLGKVITDILSEQKQLSAHEQAIIFDWMNHGIAEAAESYFEIHIAREKMARSQAESGTRSMQVEQELREQFIYTLTHDLRTPLAAAKMSAQLIARRLDQPDVLLRLSLKINDDLDRIGQMVRDFLDFSRIHAGQKLPLNIAHVNLRSIVSETVEDLSTIHGNRFVLTNGSIEGFWCGKSLRRALENLLNNAVKYGCPRSPISISVRKKGEEVELSVHNEGEPISPEQQKVLFKPYRRSQAAEKSGKAGWGIGLTLVHGVAEAHGGHVEVESSPGKGTTFTLVLPLDSRPFQKAAA